MGSFIGAYTSYSQKKVLTFKLNKSVDNCWPFTMFNIVPRQFSDQSIGTKSCLQHLFCAPEKNCELIDQSYLRLWTLAKIEGMKIIKFYQNGEIRRVLRIQQRKLHPVKGITREFGGKKCPGGALRSSTSREGGGLRGMREAVGITQAHVIAWLCGNGTPFLNGKMIRIHLWLWRTKKKDGSNNMNDT